MSNQWSVTTKPIGSEHGVIIRRIDRAEPYYLRENGRNKTFPTAMEAEVNGLRHVLDLLNKECRFTRAARSEPSSIDLEKQVFGTVTSRKGDQTVVERRHRRRPAKRQSSSIVSG